MSLERASSISRGNIMKGKRKHTLSFEDAVKTLRRSNYLEFLDNPNVKKTLSPATDLLGNFGQGHSRELMNTLWHHMWLRTLVVVETQGATAKCVACNYTRVLEFDIYVETPNGREYIGCMGRDCYEVKFRVLRRLVRSLYNGKIKRAYGLIQAAREAEVNMRLRY